MPSLRERSWPRLLRSAGARPTCTNTPAEAKTTATRVAVRSAVSGATTATIRPALKRIWAMARKSDGRRRDGGEGEPAASNQRRGRGHGGEQHDCQDVHQRRHVAHRCAAQDRVQCVGLYLGAAHAIEGCVVHIGVTGAVTPTTTRLSRNVPGATRPSSTSKSRHAADRPRGPAVVDPRRAIALLAHRCAGARSGGPPRRSAPCRATSAAAKAKVWVPTSAVVLTS